MKRWWVFLVVWLAATPAMAFDVKIYIPPEPKGFPTEFPKYEKCVVGGKRRACYDLEKTRQLLMLWSRYGLLMGVIPALKAQGVLLDKQDAVIKSYKKQVSSLRKALTSMKKANTALEKKVKREQARKKAAEIRHAIISTVVTVGVLGVGIGIGYLIAKNS